MTPSLCSLFQDLACKTMRHMTDAYNRGYCLSETTITEVLLLTLSHTASPHLKVTPFSLGQEKVNGADYEFFFSNSRVGKGKSVRIQAKRLFPTDGSPNPRYKSLHRAWSSQWTKLCKQALIDKVTPLYAFYNHDKFLSTYPHGGFTPDCVWGCSIAPITSIPRISPQNPSNIKNMRPWHVLVCSGKGERMSLLELVHNKLGELYAEDSRFSKPYAEDPEFSRLYAENPEFSELYAENPNLNFGLCEPPDWTKWVVMPEKGKSAAQRRLLRDYLKEKRLKMVVHIEETE